MRNSKEIRISTKIWDQLEILKVAGIMGNNRSQVANQILIEWLTHNEDIVNSALEIIRQRKKVLDSRNLVDPDVSNVLKRIKQRDNG